MVALRLINSCVINNDCLVFAKPSFKIKKTALEEMYA